MVKAHSPINWENEPSFNTPINETNLNKMDSTIGILDDRIIEQDTVKLDKSTAYTMVKDISFNENNGVFTITLLNGSTKTLDTKLEKISINFDYNEETQQIEIILIDGTKQYIDISSLISPIDFVDSDTIGWEVTSDWKVKAKVLDGSITEDMLQPNYLAEIKVETEKSAQSMANSKISENNAKQSELNAKASEEQALEYSNNAQPLAQSVSGNNPTATNSADGNVIYLNNKGYTQQDGTPSPDNPIRIGASADKGYFDGELESGYISITDGSLISSTASVRNKNGISCNKGDSIVVSYEGIVGNDLNGIRLIFYDDSNAFISSHQADKNVLSITAPTNSSYMKFYLAGSASNNIIITPSTAKHICVTINGQYAVRVKTSHKNLLTHSIVSKTEYGLTRVRNSDDSLTFSGTTTGALTYACDNIIDRLEVGQTYIWSGVTSMRIKEDGANKYLGASGEYTITDKTTVFEPYYQWGSGVTVNKTYYPMVRLKGTDDTYEPHQESEALIPVSSPLYNGDYIEVHADGSGREYHKMASIVYDGSDDEGWKYMSEYPTRVYANISNAKISTSRTSVLCSHFTSDDITNNRKGLCFIGTNKPSSLYVYPDLDVVSVESFKEWLQSNPIHVVYEKAEPTSTPLTKEQVAEFMKLRTYKGVTHVTADGEVTMRYYVDNDSGETVSMLQNSLPQTYSREFEWTTPRQYATQHFDFKFNNKYNKVPTVMVTIRDAEGVIACVRDITENGCSVTITNLLEYTAPIAINGSVDILVV